MQKLRLDLPLLLPELPDLRDACVARLQALLSPRRGVLRTHVRQVDGRSELCVHYDAALITGEEVKQLAHAAGAEVHARVGHYLIPLRAVAGEDAGRRIEQTLSRIDGVLAVSVNLPAQRARIEFDRERLETGAIDKAIRDLGFSAEEAALPPAPPLNWYRRNRELVWSLTGGALLVGAFSIERALDGRTAGTLAFYAASYVFGAFDLVRHALASLRRRAFVFDIDLLMLLAAVGAAILGEWAEGAFLLFLFSLAHSLEHYALGRARASIRALADLAPPIARVQQGQNIVEVPVERVSTGDLVLVRPADRIPVDGTVQTGQSAVNQAPITGESVPVDKSPGDEVFAGTVNGEGVLTIVTTRAAGDRTLDRVMKLVEEAQTAKAPTQLFTERFERVFVPAVLVADVALMVVPPLLGFWTWSTSFYRAMALLVAASPCALALGTPATVLAGIARAARRGVLVKGGVHLENLGTIRALALDKTGTLTVGQPEVTDVEPAGSVAPTELLRVAASVERQSQHPLAQAVVRKATAEGIAIDAADAVESVTGRGIRAKVGGRRVEIGNLRMFAEANVEIPPGVREAVTRLQNSGRSVMLVRREDAWLGVLGMADQPRADVRQVLNMIRRLGVAPLVMLTGDHRSVGETVGREVGVDEIRAELLPESKVTAIEELAAQHGAVAMVGDGVNDAPALAQATVGIAMGGAGTAAALETADVALMADDLGRLPFAIGLSRQARAIIRQNLWLSMAVIALLILATTTGVVGIGPAVFVHEGSTLVVVANALRLLRYELAAV
jgi:Cd2+/Zn2+-exporting ATPase